MSEQRVIPKDNIHLLKISITDQEGLLLGDLTSEGYDLRQTLQRSRFMDEISGEIRRILSGRNVNFDPWYAAAEICSEFDAKILSEMEEEQGSTEDNPKFHSAFAIGGGRPSSDTPPFRLTPLFRSYNELEEWCRKRIQKFRYYARTNKVLPDTVDWAEDESVICIHNFPVGKCPSCTED
jgi:hypothetical protein